MNEFDLRGTDLRDLEQQREMCAEAIEFTIEDGREPEPKMYDLLAAYDARIARLSGSTLAAPRPTDDVRRVVDARGAHRVAGGGQGNAYPASEKQVNFLRKLLGERDLSGAGSVLGPITPPASLDGIGKRAATALIDRLLNAPYKSAAPTPKNLPSQRQLDLIRKLLVEKDLESRVYNPAPGVELCTFQDWQGHVPAFTKQTVSKAIDALFSYPRKQVAPKQPEREIVAGAYQVGEKIVRVYLGQQSGRMLAAELVDITAEHRDDAWAYLGAASRFVPADAHRLTVEECEAIAGASGQSFSWCCVCGRRLDDPNSVSRGIGPVCRAKQGM